MRRVIKLISTVGLLGLLVGCDEEVSKYSVEQLYRANQELATQCQSQARIIFMMGASIILMGASLAVSLGVLLKRGRRQTACIPEKAAVD